MKYLNSSIGRLRLMAFLEGTSLLILIFIAMPFKYLLDIESIVKIVGPIHGVLFVLFVLMTLAITISDRWNLFKRTSIVLISSFIPFGTFIVDHYILKQLHHEQSTDV